MRKTIKNLLERNAYLIASLLTAFIMYGSLASLPKLDVEITNSDKILHAVVYLILTLSWLFSIKKSHKSIKTKVQIGFTVFVFGIIIEVLQSSLTIYRSGDFLDVIANSTGIIVAIITFNRLFRWYKII